MLDFNNFCEAFRSVFKRFLDLSELTSEELNQIPEKFSGISTKIDLSGSTRATLWLNLPISAVRLAMKKLNIAESEEDRMLMDAAGEVLNIIVGAGQRNSKVRYDFSLPSAYKGESYPLRIQPNSIKKCRQFLFEDFKAYLILEELK